MRGQTVILIDAARRALAKSLIDRAPDRSEVVIGPPLRTNDQNAKMRAMISDISRAKCEGRMWIPETWKCGLMALAGHQSRFENGLDGTGPFPSGFHSSRLTKEQMSDLIEVMYDYGARHGVEWGSE